MSWRRASWWVAVPLAGAAVWVAVLGSRLRGVDERWWIARDDGVITLSHARNLARFGSIGVSPGGDRVEGFSSPLHFAVGYVMQVVTDIDYRVITIVILVLGLVVTGAALATGACAAGRSAGWSLRSSAVVGVLAAASVAVGVAASWTTTGWMGSGMENPLVVAAGATVIGAGPLARCRPRVGLIVLGAGITALMVARVEFAAFTVPVLLAAAAVAREAGAARRAVISVAVVPLVLALLVHVARRLYFGAWLPNTALVQQRDSGLTEVALLAALTVLLALLLLRTESRGRLRGGSGRMIDATISVAVLLAAAAIVWASITGRSAGSLAQLLLLPSLLPLLLLVGVLLIGWRAAGGRVGAVDHLALAVCAIPLAQYLATGPARLDQFRVAGIATVFLAAWASLLVVRLLAAALPVMRRASMPWAGPAFGAAVAVTVIVPVAWIGSNDGARPLQYEIGWADDLAVTARAIGDERVGERGHVLLANPDLGKVSFAKSAIMVDLGLLGDPVMARLTADHPDLVAEYLGEVAVPDIVRLHSGWSCPYLSFLESPEFLEEYLLHGSEDGEQTRASPTCPIDGAFGVWVRDSSRASQEYSLTRRLLRDGSEDEKVGAVTSALERCRAEDQSPFRCQSVRRAVQRAAAHLREEGQFARVVDAFETSPSGALDDAMLHRGPGWSEVVVAEFVELAEKRPG